MFKLSCVILGVSYFVLLTSAESVAPFIHPCGITDSACILKSADIALPYIVKGVPSLGMIPLDPMVLKSVEADNGENKLSFKDFKFVGASKLKFVEIVRDADKNTAKIVVDLPIDLSGPYVMKGPVYGEGNAHIYSDKLRIILDIRMKNVEIDGRKHYKITGFDYVYELLSKFTFNLENLFGGDKTQAEPVMQVMNENWKETIDGFGKKVFLAVIKEIIKVIDKLFTGVPADQLEIA